jgi:hypothetical protein
VTVETPGSCSRIGADRTVTADIAQPRGNHYEMTACLRSPGDDGNEKLVNDMLASVKVTA